MYKLLCKFVISIILVASVFGFAAPLDAVTAQAAQPIQKFQTTYKGYNPSTSWISQLSPAQRCSKTMKIYGAKPTAVGNYPTLLYVHGTFAEGNSNKEGQRFIELAAAQGFNAMAITYNSDNSLSPTSFERKAYCMFDQNHPQNAVTAACATVGTDCSKGVAVTGFSQGASIALLAKNYTQNVKAVWAIGVSAYNYPKYTIPTSALPAPYGTRALSNDKLVINMGQSSNLFTKSLLPVDIPSLKQLTGADCGTSLKCLQPNGSGYYVVANSEVADGTADHAYWMMANKYNKGALSWTLSPNQLEPGFQAPSTTDWSMTHNLDWLRSQLL